MGRTEPFGTSALYSCDEMQEGGLIFNTPPRLFSGMRRFENKGAKKKNKIPRHGSPTAFFQSGTGLGGRPTRGQTPWPVNQRSELWFFHQAAGVMIRCPGEYLLSVGRVMSSPFMRLMNFTASNNAPGGRTRRMRRRWKTRSSHLQTDRQPLQIPAGPSDSPLRRLFSAAGAAKPI